MCFYCLSVPYSFQIVRNHGLLESFLLLINVSHFDKSLIRLEFVEVFKSRHYSGPTINRCDHIHRNGLVHPWHKIS